MTLRMRERNLGLVQVWAAQKKHSGSALESSMGNLQFIALKVPVLSSLFDF